MLNAVIAQLFHSDDDTDDEEFEEIVDGGFT